MIPVRTLLVSFAVTVVASLPLSAGSPRPVGTWTREAKPLQVTVTFTESRITAKATMTEVGVPCTFSLDAEFSVTSDGLLYGVVTGVDADKLDVSSSIQAIAGQPFAARYRVDDGVLLIREVRFLGTGFPNPGAKTEYDGIVGAIAGRYVAVSPAAAATTDRRGRRIAPVVVAPQTLGLVPSSSPPGGVVPSYLIHQWEKDTGGTIGIDFERRSREVAPAPRGASRR